MAIGFMAVKVNNGVFFAVNCLSYLMAQQPECKR